MEWPKRTCWWQMENQEVWPLGEPKEGKYYGRCACPDQDQKGMNHKIPCFWPEHLRDQCEHYHAGK